MALIIDEIQKAPILLGELKKTIDSQRLIWLREGQERQLMYIYPAQIVLSCSKAFLIP